MSDEIPNGTVNQQALIDEVGRIHKQYSDAEFKTFADQMDEVGVKTAELCAQLQEANADVESLASTRDRDQARYRLAGLKTRQLVDRADDAMAELNTGVDLAVSLGVPEAAELEFVMTALGTDTEGYRGARFTLLTAAQELATYGDLTRFSLAPDYLDRLNALNTEIRAQRDSASIFEIRRQVHVYALHKRIDQVLEILTRLSLAREAAMARAAAKGIKLEIPGFDLGFLRAAAAAAKSVKLDRTPDSEPTDAGM
jgi:hypothetical protein